LTANKDEEFEFQFIKFEKTSSLIQNNIIHVNILNFNTSSSSAEENGYEILLPASPKKEIIEKIQDSIPSGKTFLTHPFKDQFLFFFSIKLQPI
jgi:hypothetical protein